MIPHNEDTGNDSPKSTDEKLKEIYADMTKQLNTDAMLGILLHPYATTDELVEGVKNKILTLSRN